MGAHARAFLGRTGDRIESSRSRRESSKLQNTAISMRGLFVGSRAKDPSVYTDDQLLSPSVEPASLADARFRGAARPI